VTDETEGWDAELRQLWEQSQPLLRERLAALEDAAVAILEGSLDAERRLRAQSEAHKLAGSLGSFGLHEGSRLARELESVLQGERPIDQRQALVVSEMVLGLAGEIESEPQSLSLSDPPERRISVLLVTPDRDFGLRVTEAAAVVGIDVTVSSTTGAAREATAESCLAVVLDAGSGADLEIVGRLAQGNRPIQAVVVADPEGEVNRGAAAAVGARGFVAKPASPKAIVTAIRRLLEDEGTVGTVLVVDDDPVAAGLLRAMLVPRGYEVVHLEDPRRFWETLERVRPDLVMLDYDMPHVDGIQLCRMLRNDETWNAVPVIFLSAAAGDAVAREMFAAGADDHLRKPVVEADLVTRVANRLQRSRTQREVAETDSGTGLPVWRVFLREAERLVARARHDRQPVAVGCLAADEAGSDTDPDGTGSPQVLALLVRALRSALQPADCVGLDQQRRVVVALAGQDAAEGVDRLARVIEAVRAEKVRGADGGRPATVSGGVARFPADGDTVAALVKAAQGALGEAGAAGGDRVVSTARDGDRRLDVLVVDDDEVLGTLLVHALTTRGYRTMWLQDGAEAAAFLSAGDSPRVRVVLLDVGLPGLDGLSVLRSLAQRGALVATRVIMVTLRSTEAEVLAALELGAFDHVAKPFSVPVLLHRVRRALDTLPA
jgi:DNA-binding response OmpR family regulator/HPt (histidine-containing phosphotransfer) domain-containing protein